jgi:hypothetical protein
MVGSRNRPGLTDLEHSACRPELHVQLSKKLIGVFQRFVALLRNTFLHKRFNGAPFLDFGFSEHLNFVGVIGNHVVTLTRTHRFVKRYLRSMMESYSACVPNQSQMNMRSSVGS